MGPATRPAAESHHISKVAEELPVQSPCCPDNEIACCRCGSTGALYANLPPTVTEHGDSGNCVRWDLDKMMLFLLLPFS